MNVENKKGLHLWTKFWVSMAFGVFSSPFKHCDIQIFGPYIVLLPHSILKYSIYYLLEMEGKKAGLTMMAVRSLSFFSP